MQLRAEEARYIANSSGYSDLKDLLLLIHICAVKGMLSYTVNSDMGLDRGLAASLRDLGYKVETYAFHTEISW